MPAKKTEKKVLNDQVEKVVEKENILVVRANKPLDRAQYNLLSDLVREEEKKAGVKIVLVPHSVDVDDVQ